jgi:hypothetical protein
MNAELAPERAAIVEGYLQETDGADSMEAQVLLGQHHHVSATEDTQSTFQKT